MPDLSEPHPWDRLPRPLRGVQALASGLVTTAGITVACLVASRWLPAHGVGMLYILGVVGSAVLFGTRSGLYAALTSFLTFNYFFLQPTYTFTIADARDLVALIVFLGVAVATGSLAGRLREVAEAHRQSARSLAALNTLVLRLSGTTTFESLATVLCEEASKVAAAPVLVLRGEGEQFEISARTADAPDLETADWQAALRSAASRQPIYPAAPGWTGTHYEFHPILVRDRAVAMLGVHQNVTDDNTDATLAAIARQAAVAIERLVFEAEKAAAEKQAEIERFRAMLLSSVSHDIKTPLASIRGAVSSLRELGAKLAEETQSDLLATIDEEAQRLSRFVTNLLDMARLQTTPETLAHDWIDLTDTISAAASRMRQMRPRANIRLDLGDGAAMIRGDEILIEHVFLNVLENALNFSEEGGAISVSLRHDETGLRVTIDDQGAGIAAEDLPKVFDTFYRGRGHKVQGSGLGLSICRDVMAAHGGSIAAISPGQSGTGTSIVLLFPQPKTDTGGSA